MSDLDISDAIAPDLEAEVYAQALLEACYENQSLFNNAGDASEAYVRAESAYRRQRSEHLRNVLPGPWWACCILQTAYVKMFQLSRGWPLSN